jgi:hypothetical protein
MSLQACPNTDVDCSEARKAHAGHNFVCLQNNSCGCESVCDGLGFLTCGADQCGGVCGECPSGAYLAQQRHGERVG